MTAVDKNELSTLSLKLFEHWGITTLPFDPSVAARAEGVLIKRPTREELALFPALARGEAALLTGGACPVILFAGSFTPQRERWSVAHELSHLIIGAQEGQADALAGLLLCPPVVLHLCAVRSPREITGLCGVSAHAASIAFSQVQTRRAAGNFLHTPQERRCAERFLPFISQILSRAAAAPRPEIDL